MVKTIFIFVMILFLGGCASSVQKKLDVYIGMNILEAQKHFGYNFKTTKLNDGNTAYTWIRSKSGGSIHKGTGGIFSNQCEFSLIADPNGKIISNQFRDTHRDSVTCYRYMD
jgi:hypothetical protein